jgi:hypothetical protein
METLGTFDTELSMASTSSTVAQPHEDIVSMVSNRKRSITFHLAPEEFVGDTLLLIGGENTEHQYKSPNIVKVTNSIVAAASVTHILHTNDTSKKGNKQQLNNLGHPSKVPTPVVPKDNKMYTVEACIHSSPRRQRDDAIATKVVEAVAKRTRASLSVEITTELDKNSETRYVSTYGYYDIVLS